MKFLALHYGNYLFCGTGIGHGGSDGLHGYVPSLDHVVADTVSSVVLYSFLNAFLLIGKKKKGSYSLAQPFVGNRQNLESSLPWVMACTLF